MNQIAHLITIEKFLCLSGNKKDFPMNFDAKCFRIKTLPVLHE